jgi:hypothetical protein
LAASEFGRRHMTTRDAEFDPPPRHLLDRLDIDECTGRSDCLRHGHR